MTRSSDRQAAGAVLDKSPHIAATLTPHVPATTRRVHLTLQGKGGVGKSFVSALIAQFYRANGRPITCLDTDPVNATFSGYAALGADRVDLLEGSKVSERRFDQMMERLLAEDTDFVVDNGAASFIPLSNYLIENQAVELLAQSGRQVVVHTVVTGGQALRDTLSGFASLAEQLPREASLVVWLNEFFGDIAMNGRGFEAMRAYETHRDRVAGIVRIPRQTSDTFGRDVEQMLDRKLTFEEVAASPDFGLMARQRLAMVRRAIFDQLQHVL